MTTKYAMDTVTLNVADFLSGILSPDFNGVEFVMGSNVYHVDVIPAGGAFKGEFIWDSIEVSCNGGPVFNCGNRHGGRRILAACLFEDLQAMAADKETTAPHFPDIWSSVYH